MARPCKVPDRVILRAAEYYATLGSHCGRRVRTARGQPHANEVGLIELLAGELKISKPVIHRVLRRGPRSGAPLPAMPIGFERGLTTSPAPSRLTAADVDRDLAKIGLRPATAAPAAVPPSSSVTARNNLQDAIDWALSEGGFPADFVASAEALLVRLRTLA